LGEDEVHKYVGREPSGSAFNELKLNKDLKPHNPLINSGAIMTTSLIEKDLSLSDRFEFIINKWTELSGGMYKVGFNNSVYLSEKDTADRNFALAYFMKELSGFPDGSDINKTLELYFQCCSIEVNCNILAIVAATMANGGINPYTGLRVWKSDTVTNVLSMMLMCGMYDYSGEFAFKIGLPAKSGVAGAIMTVIPGVMGYVTWSPKLDQIGNSYRGIEFSKKMGEIFNIHIFNTMGDTTKDNICNSKYDNNNIKEFYELCLSASKGDLEYLKILFNRNVDMNQSDYDGRTALHLAVSEHKIKVVEYLVNVAKVNTNVKDRWGRTPLSEATDNKYEDIMCIIQRSRVSLWTRRPVPPLTPNIH
jgi:glutaminase